MSLAVHTISPEIWQAKFSEHAHRICFGTIKTADQDRIDYALLVVDEKTDMPVGYVTCRENDKESVYVQFGGVFPVAKNKLKAWRIFEIIVDYHKCRYKRMAMLIENTNKPMLKFAMQGGLTIVGVRTFQNHVLLEHLLEF